MTFKTFFHLRFLHTKNGKEFRSIISNAENRSWKHESVINFYTLRRMDWGWIEKLSTVSYSCFGFAKNFLIRRRLIALNLCTRVTRDGRPILAHDAMHLDVAARAWLKFCARSELASLTHRNRKNVNHYEITARSFTADIFRWL